tara:strand:- start:370 stop:693 length:324 start_codon:yes stop_codon:yes gene_type:complete
MFAARGNEPEPNTKMTASFENWEKQPSGIQLTRGECNQLHNILSAFGNSETFADLIDMINEGPLRIAHEDEDAEQIKHWGGCVGSLSMLADKNSDVSVIFAKLEREI